MYMIAEQIKMVSILEADTGCDAMGPQYLLLGMDKVINQ
jgi:hypothetical protein